MVEKNDPVVTQIVQKITDVWELFTDTPKLTSSKVNQATKEGINVLRLEKISKIESNSIEFNKFIFELTMKINRK